ncbi:hypothetical protein ACFQ9Z_38070, partial [Streptomyces sp. NPDC056580]|uniref:hypothetical protein n=1 Tax=Streptomyces sp. NPDC056580 TaxID=3345872 RepID=UPI00367F8849
ELVALMETPLYLELLKDGAVTHPYLPSDVHAAVLLHGAEAGRQVLLEDYVNRQLNRRVPFKPKRDALKSYAAYIAYEMQRTIQPSSPYWALVDHQPSPAAVTIRALAWWRFYNRVPAWVFGLFSAVAAAPAYVLCLQMPVGLTRGFCVGSITGVVLGVCRGVRTSRAALVALFSTAAAVLPLGLWLEGLPIALSDAAEIAPPVAIVFLLRDLLAGSRIQCLFSAFTASVTSAGAVAAIPAAGLPHANDRTFLGVMVAVFLGVLVAAFSARLLSHPESQLTPSTADFRPRRSRLGPLLPHLVAATAAASAVGIAGAAVGGIFHHSLRHGLSVGLVFAVMAAGPIGVTAGFIQWLNQPASRPTASFDHLYRHDRRLALLSVLSVGLASTLSIAALRTYLGFLVVAVHDPTFTPQPIVGLLFGATLGVIVAAFNTAWLNYVICTIYFAVRGRMPWMLFSALRLLHTCEILHQQGPILVFRTSSLQDYFASRHPHP